MSSPIRVLCRTCGIAAYGPDGRYQEELQQWYEIRHALAEIRANWPGYGESPKIDHDYDTELTRLLCDHKDHDLCMTEPHDHKKVYEFDKTKEQPQPFEKLRVFRELRDMNNLRSDIMEIDPAPVLHVSIVRRSKIGAISAELDASPPCTTRRFVFQREKMVLLRTYVEE